MDKRQISAELKSFIKENLHSVYALETLLLLHRNQGKTFNASDIASELGFDEEVAQEQVRALKSIGLLSDSGDFSYTYDPSDDKFGGLVDALAVAYSNQRVPILSLILTNRSDRIRLFAEAFRLIRGSD